MELLVHVGESSIHESRLDMTATDKNQVTIIANEYNGAALILSYWTTALPNYAWILLCWAFFTFTSLLGVLVYGEMEFWLATFKFIATIALYLVAMSVVVLNVAAQHH